MRNIPAITITQLELLYKKEFERITGSIQEEEAEKSDTSDYHIRSEDIDYDVCSIN